MKYNSIENAEQFIADQIAWAKANRYGDFTIWSNGKELVAMLDDNDLATVISRGELKYKNFWKAIIYRNGHRVEM